MINQFLKAGLVITTMMHLPNCYASEDMQSNERGVKRPAIEQQINKDNPDDPIDKDYPAQKQKCEDAHEDQSGNDLVFKIKNVWFTPSELEKI